jgi:hypothetical protein
MRESTTTLSRRSPDNNSLGAELQKLPSWLRRRLASCPRSPRGVHQWMFATSRRLLAYVDEEVTFQLLRERTRDHTRIGRRVRDREIYSQIQSAVLHPWRPPARRDPHA